MPSYNSVPYSQSSYYTHHNPTVNPTFPGQDFMPSYNSVPYSQRNYYTHPSSVDTDRELDPNVQTVVYGLCAKTIT